MDSAWLSQTRARFVRLRWRRAGAWLWPAFVVLTIADAVVGHVLPPAGDSETVAAAALLGLVANLLGVILLSRPLGMLIRRARPDLPAFIARDYGGTTVVLALTATLLLVGLVHGPAIRARQHEMQDAITRAQAWIGDRAPDQFKRNLAYVSVFAIQPGTIYRACVPNPDRTKNYCVIVNRRLPFERSVTFSGYEPNSSLAAGTG
jgi:hypothetical protein